MAKTPATPQVPGEPAVIEPVAETGDQAAVEETVAVPKVQLDALLSRLDALENQAKAAKQDPSRQARKEANLPDQDKVDLATLKTPVLTKQGWLVPEQYGSHPNAKP